MCSRTEVIVGCERPPGSQSESNNPAVVELDHTAIIDARAQPFVGRDLLDHADAKARVGHCEVIDGRAKTDEGEPIFAVGGAIDIVAITREIVDQQFFVPAFGPAIQ